MKWLATCLLFLLIATLALACEEEEEGATATASPGAPMTVTREATPNPQVPATLEATPTSELEDEYEGWLTYTNDVYGYEIRYPPGANIREWAPSHMSPEEADQGVTWEELLGLYTAKICVEVDYDLGYVLFSAPANNGGFRYVNCGRTSRAFEGPSREETLLIEGKTYTAGGFEEQGPGETIEYHNETLNVTLDDGTRIEYGAMPVGTATFDDYLLMRDDLLKIVQSYRKLP
jgi:hypothetical protein